MPGLSPSRRVALALSALGLAGLAGACFDGEKLQGAPCAVDRDCGPHLQCGVDGVCGGSKVDCSEDFGEDLDVDLENLYPNVFLVLDRSGSMDEVYAPGRTRWQIQVDIVESILAASKGAMNVGAVLFPSSDAKAGNEGYGQDGCPSSVAPDVGFCTVDEDPDVDLCPGDPLAIPDVLAASTPRGNSPTTAAFKVALAAFEGLHPDLTRAIVLIVDDAPNCMEVKQPKTTDPRLVELLDPELEEVVAAAAADGIPTFVLGIGIPNADNLAVQGDGKIDNINPMQVLNGIAAAGGRPRPGERAFYTPEEADELLAALLALPAATLNCTIDFGRKSVYPELLEVRVDGDEVPRRQADVCGEDGYRYTSDRLDAIELCGAACDAYRSSRNLEITYYCLKIG
ncbi:MAG: hypothetical protein R3B09_07150 [Nannocystaceae bacterium]